MTARLFQFSGVVVGQAHNPTILNPDFLAAEGIVPKSWNWSVSETITTPPLAIVRYSNGTTITVEPHKLQVTDPNAENGPHNSKVIEIASAYVRVLPHVRYTASGNNFQSLIQRDAPEEYLKSRFLKVGSSKQSLSQTQTLAETAEPIRHINRLLGSLPKPWKIGLITKNCSWIS